MMNKSDFERFIEKCEASDELLPNGCTILRDTEQDQLVLMKETATQRNDQFKPMLEALAKQKQLYHEHLLSLIDYYGCRQTGRIFAFYEYSTHSLIQEIEARLQEQKQFTSEQLENILVSALKVLAYLEEEETGHGCMSVLDICLADGMVKVVDPSIASASPLSITEGYYYSPELLQHIISKSQEDIDIFKNDVFCLALCILHCGLLQSCEDCFDYEEGLFRFEMLEDKISRFHELYGDRLVKILVHMLDENAETRFTVPQLFEQIEAQYEEEDDAQTEQEDLSEFEQNGRISHEPSVASYAMFQSHQHQGSDWSRLLSSKLSSKESVGHGPIQNPITQIKREKQMMKQAPVQPLPEPPKQLHQVKMAPVKLAPVPNKHVTMPSDKPFMKQMQLQKQSSNKQNFCWPQYH